MIDLNSYTTQEVATLKQRTLNKRHVLAQVIAQFSQQYPNDDFIDRALMRVMLEIGSVLSAIEDTEVVIQPIEGETDNSMQKPSEAI